MKKTETGRNAFLILHDIRSAENVGALFRTADAAGVTKIYLTGYSPQPLDRFGRKRKDVGKAALGAEESVQWEAAVDPIAVLLGLRASGVTIVAIEQSPRAVDYKTLAFTGDVAFVLGNEVTGISEELLALADHVAEIPMQGMKESLNVSVAGGIALFRMLGH